jgi:hypothetical protein
MGYADHKNLFYDLLRKGSAVQQGKIREQTVTHDIVVPITKIYYIDEIPSNAKCMITSLPLDFQVDDIVVCPYCSAWAKKELLANWLLEKNKCPVCQRELTIEDCPVVEVRLK